jgi:hypothetical protein
MPSINPKYDTQIFKDMQIKTAMKDGSMKLFVSADANILSKFPTTEGKALPERTTVILGNTEAEMMKKEKLFSKPGDKISDFFGINTSVGGILKRTGSVIDDMHFLSDSEYDQIQGEQDRAFIELKDDKTPKLFYTYKEGEDSQFTIPLKEGDIQNYDVHTLSGEKYYPVILGFQEAEMMREEKLFAQPGDIIKNFFGINIFIVGVMKKTNSSIDMMHILPLTRTELLQSSQKKGNN